MSTEKKDVPEDSPAIEDARREHERDATASAKSDDDGDYTFTDWASI